MIRTMISVLLGALLCASTASAGEIRQSSPQRHGFSEAGLDRLTNFMDARVAEGAMVGGMGLIARDGKIVYQQTYGMADREAGRAMNEDAIFRIYSMTKPITGVALMMLFEEGKFKLNDPVGKYLPELADLEVALSTADTSSVSDGIITRNQGQVDESVLGQTRPAARQPTIRDLLMHTAGFTYGVFGRTEVDQQYAELWAKGDLSLQQFVAELGKIPLQYEPGTRWHYSVAVDVQGRLVEVLSGMKFSEFLQQRIFVPLDMRDTFFTVPQDKLPRLAQLYKPKGIVGTDFLAPVTGKGLEVADAETSAGFVQPRQFESGGAGLLSTTRDYLRFSQMLLNGGELDGVRLLSPKTVEFMTSDHIGNMVGPYGRPGYGFGLGFGVTTDPAAAGTIGSAGEYSWGGAAGTRFWVDPAENLIGIFMTQTVPNRTRFADQFKALTYGALTQSKTQSNR